MSFKSKLSKLITGFTAAAMCLTMLPDVSMTSEAASVGDKLSVGNGTNQHKGNCDGYSYEIWLDTTGGSGTMTLGKGATFKAEWSASVPSGNFLARRGLDFGSQKKATDYGYIGMDYVADYRQTGSNSGNSRLCVYGWFQNKGLGGNIPLVEYYIIEDWVDWCPDGNGKMVTIDGAQYKIFSNSHSGPSINSGYETFQQYFSVRQQKRKSGHITVSDHFQAWADQGWGIGNLYEVALNAEGWQSSGVADITELDVYTDERPTDPTEPPEPEEEINFTKPSGSGSGASDDFEGSGTDWTARGEDLSYGLTSDFAHSGSKSLYVKDRTQSWNGFSLTSDELEGGASYEISAYTAFKSKIYGSMGFTLGVQYDLDGTTEYVNLVDATGDADEWVELAAEFEIPDDAQNISLYVQSAYTETASDADLLPFFLDDVVLVKEGGTPPVTEEPTEPSSEPSTDVTLAGDANCDGVVTIADATAIFQYIGNPDKYALSEEGRANSDVDGTVGITAADAMEILKYDAKIIDKLTATQVAGSKTTKTTTKTTKTTTKTTAKTTANTTTTANNSSSSITPQEYMAEAKANFTANVPSDVKNGDSGSTKKIYYYSKKAQKNKPANVWLPPNYSESEKYPVVYMNHGVMGGEDDLLSGWSIREMATNLIKKGEVKPFIIVFTQMYTDPNADRATAITQEQMDRYDDFLYDLTESLMPYMAENYSIAEGRENTAIAGFSMGGRESLYIGMKAADKIGYVCASSPAPGIVPAQDMFLNHRGSMTESEFKFSEPYLPYLLMIGGGTNDGVVGTFPKQYHELYDKNGVDNIWFEVQGGGHDASVGTPLFYNFFRHLFRA
ncbi:MAG: glycoside hydrolase family 11 protein [Ruminococcus sp.]|nr:glycoside hydrolase family 11 protein [Ruminococcus sp.]